MGLQNNQNPQGPAVYKPGLPPTANPFIGQSFGNNTPGGNPSSNQYYPPVYTPPQAASPAAPGATGPAAEARGGVGHFGAPASVAPPASGPLSGPGAAENFYSQHGNDLMTPSASESLYAEGDAGSNPYYDYAEKQASGSIDAAERARGGFNSGAALQEIGNSSANLRGQQAHELGQLAGQADTAKLGRYGLTGQEALTSEQEQQNRILGGINAETGIDTSAAGAVSPFYATAGSEGQQSGMAAIEAQMKASGMSAAEIKQYTDILTSLGGAAIKAA